MSDHVENIEMEEEKCEDCDEIEVQEEESDNGDEEEEAESKDSDEDSDEDEVAEEEEEVEEEEDYYYHGKRGWDYYNDHECKECKKCKNDKSYAFVTINPVILTNVPKLMDMASVTVAATLWNHINIPRALSNVTDRCTKSTTKWNTLCGKVIALIDQLPLPKPLAEQITRYVRIMTTQITAWVSYHYRTVFFKYGIDKFVYSLVYHIAWYPTGAINCAQTARNMMTSMRLSDVEKFRFLSVYCLKDEMDRMPTSLYSDNIRDYPNFQEYPMIFYWYCFYRNKLSKISRTNGYDPDLSIDVYMLRHTKVDNWFAKRYFFDRLSSEDQVQQAIWLIDKHGVVYQKAVMLKLNEMQREHVYMERATKIIVNYTRPRINSRFILQTWFEARNLMNKDQFLTLIRDLLKTEIKDDLLTTIWNSACDDFKRYVVGVNGHEIVGKVLIEWKWCNDSEFVFVLLHDSSSSIRKSVTTKKFFNTYCERLMEKSKFQDLDRLLEFCLSNADDFAQLKINLVSNSRHVRQVCFKCYSLGDTKGLNDYLNQLLAPYPESVLRYKKNLLESLEGFKMCVNLMDTRFDVLNAILKDGLTVPTSITEYKKNMILSSEAITKLQNLLKNKRLDVVQICIKRYLLSTDDKNALKKQLVGDVMQLMNAILRNSDESYLQCVLIWWFGNEDTVLKFKRTLDLDSIFLKMLKDCVFYEYNKFLTQCSFKRCQASDFDVLDRFLNWYFQSPDKVKEYRMRIIRSYSQIDMFQTILRGNRGDSQLKSMLQWFFKNDAVEIFKFKKLGGKITTMI
ncbi:uncharacterized protein LOC135848872 [Planococcus citri]|uniref:uncharacterized protein LOC135848872 n=1 Tax=Planococcus citri TaxID=170843 RepID=UPI0031F96E6B